MAGGWWAEGPARRSASSAASWTRRWPTLAAARDEITTDISSVSAVRTGGVTPRISRPRASAQRRFGRRLLRSIDRLSDRQTRAQHHRSGRQGRYGHSVMMPASHTAVDGTADGFPESRCHCRTSSARRDARWRISQYEPDHTPAMADNRFARTMSRVRCPAIEPQRIRWCSDIGKTTGRAAPSSWRPARCYAVPERGPPGHPKGHTTNGRGRPWTL